MIKKRWTIERLEKLPLVLSRQNYEIFRLPCCSQTVVVWRMPYQEPSSVWPQNSSCNHH